MDLQTTFIATTFIVSKLAKLRNYSNTHTSQVHAIQCPSWTDWQWPICTL